MLKEIRKELEHLQNIQRQMEEIIKDAPEGKWLRKKIILYGKKD